MNEILIIIGLVHAVVLGYFVLTRLNGKSAQQAGKTGGAQAVSVAGPAPEPKKPRLQVEGSVKPERGDTRFLKLFGLNTRPVFDMCYIEGPCKLSELNPTVANNLRQVYERGDAVGSDVMEFIVHEKALTKSQRLWFVLQSMGDAQQERLATFVDIIRPAPIAAKQLH